MGKVSSLYSKVMAGINAQGKTLTADRTADFRWASQGQDAIFANLQALINGRKKVLTQTNNRILGAMQSLVAQQQAMGQAVAQDQQATTDTYGGTTADYAAQQYAPAQASVQEGNADAAALSRQGANMAQTGAGLIKIAQAGAQEAQAGASYALSQAMDARTKADVQAIAQERQQVLQMKLQAELQAQLADRQAQSSFNTWKKQQVYLQQQATKSGLPGDPASLVQQSAQATVFLNQFLASNPGASASEAMSALSNAGFINGMSAQEQQAQQSVFTAIYQRLASLHRANDHPTLQQQQSAILGVLQQFYGTGINWGGSITSLLNSIYAQQRATSLRSQASGSLQDPYGQSGGQQQLQDPYKQGSQLQDPYANGNGF